MCTCSARSEPVGFGRVRPCNLAAGSGVGAVVGPSVPALVKMEALFSPFRGPPSHTDGREEPAQPLAIDEPSTVMQTKVPANLTATPESMGMLNTPGNGAIELDVMAHHDQVAPPASHRRPDPPHGVRILLLSRFFRSVLARGGVPRGGTCS